MTSAFADLLAAAPGSWSLAVLDADGRALLTHDDEAVRPVASSAKVLLLVAAAAAIERGDLDPDEPLRRSSVAAVADSGLWQHLRVDALPADDVARLVGSVSDNLATNVLLARLGGAGAVADEARRRGIAGIALHDFVRDERTASDPATLGTATAGALARLFATLAPAGGGDDEAGGPVASRVRGWLRDGADLSMVAGALGLDPLAHTAPDRGVALWHKTGTDTGVRADSGVIAVDGVVRAYSCLVEFDEADRDAVLAVMRAVGTGIRASF